MKKWIYVFLIIIFTFSLAGCGSDSQSTDEQYYTYYVNHDETKIEKFPCELSTGDAIADSDTVSEAESGQEATTDLATAAQGNATTDTTTDAATDATADATTDATTDTTAEITDDTAHIKNQIYELLTLLATAPESANYKAPISAKLGKVKYVYSDEQVTLYFTDAYKDLSSTTEILTRAAIVKTLTQLETVKYVTFMVQEEPLTDQDGNLVGLMTADSFIDSEGSEINTYEKTELTLFFANQDGSKLVEANRTVVYNSNISLEKLVVEQLIQGPTNTEIYPSINPDTQIINITVKDSICYVNLDESFLTPVEGVSAKITLYSIVNSLAELPGINKVQIMINGETDLTFREITDLTALFERDLTLVQ